MMPQQAPGVQLSSLLAPTKTSQKTVPPAASNCWAALKPSECADVGEPSLCYLQNKLGLLGMKEVAAPLNLINLRRGSVTKKEGYVAFAYQTAPLDFTVEQ